MPVSPPLGPPGFAAPVPADGYRWWYVDALADDGGHGLTVIAFIGSVFSPYYAWARRRGPTDPQDHCALNVGLYGPRARRWTMTERPREQVARDAAWLTLGPSRVGWDGDCLTIDVAEWAVPLPRRVRGRIRVWPQHALRADAHPLDPAARHRWRPLAPRARVEVEFAAPALRWTGTGYFDSNDGDEPLERGFVRWTWSRAELGAETAVLYDVERRDRTRGSLAFVFARDGSVQPFAPPASVALPPTPLWRIPRATRSETGGGTGGGARVLATFEDTPFYARSLVESRLLGSTARSVHESLELDRFASPSVLALLPFRMPRAPRTDHSS